MFSSFPHHCLKADFSGRWSCSMSKIPEASISHRHTEPPTCILKVQPPLDAKSFPISTRQASGSGLQKLSHFSSVIELVAQR